MDADFTLGLARHTLGFCHIFLVSVFIHKKNFYCSGRAVFVGAISAQETIGYSGKLSHSFKSNMGIGDVSVLHSRLLYRCLGSQFLARSFHELHFISFK